MPDSSTQTHGDQEHIRRVLIVMRLAYFALLSGQLGAAITLLALFRGRMPNPQPELAPTITIALIVIFLVTTPLTFFIRMQTYKKHWKGDRISPQAYIFATLLVVTAQQAIFLVSVAAAFITQAYLVTLVPAMLALLVQLANYPTGKPLERASVV
ncbi:hypothetical protein KS4_04510 [Poriferisphaera corsica]|uniref:Uncharacterized protein n=1 Tax=Poriferisphaera corsica TaxID=2528020 RepID=A0A517YQB9_9BACT|nr:hypothetical protein [Poriferisphaera corsica]QDU32419.1 hypothetical protein KS4_04510 [Poriferisphaera corsica]